MDRLAHVQLENVARIEGLRVVFVHATIVPSGARFYPALALRRSRA
jgi:intergrase/recombinase